MKAEILHSTIKYGPMRITKLTLSISLDSGRFNFYLGQDAKFCRRVLGLSLPEAIDQARMGFPGMDILDAFAAYIIEALGITEDWVLSAEPWALAAD